MKKTFTAAAALVLLLSACGNGAGAADESDNSFEDYLEEHDPDSYDTYQTLESNWNEGNWNSEDGFLGESSDYDSTNAADSYDSDTFEEYLKEHDPASYDTYQKLESNWAEGDWDPENGFLGD